MKNIYILIGLSVVAIANLLGHFLPPFSLLATFIYMNIIIGIINIPLYKINFNLTIVYNFTLLLINDLLIRLYAGGNHDSIGMAWCWLMFYIGFIIATLIMFIFSQQKIVAESKSSLRTILIGAILTGIIYEFVNAKI